MSGNNKMASQVFSLKAALWIVVIISATVYAQKEWFGSRSQYKCHCAGNNCDPNGDCAGGAECVKGWFGPQCQYVDLSYTENDGTAIQSFRDGDDTTCNMDLNHQTVVMSFKRTFPFTWLRLVVSTAGLSLDNIEVTFTDDSDNNNIKCSNKRSAVVDSRTIDIYCDVAVEVTKVLVTGQAIGYLCSFYISGGRNVALKQNTMQSTTLAGGDYGPDNAVDGNTNQNLYTGSCTATRENSYPAIWTVTLSQVNEVNRYVFYNRDTEKDRLKGFVLTAYDQSKSPTFTYTDQETTPLSVYTVTSSTQSVKSVKIEAIHTSNTDITPILTLCEVEIFGDTACPVATYGRECDQECHCANNEPCFVSTGMCPNGCGLGYTGTHCDQPCPYGFYGSNCQEQCSANCVGSGCNRITGICYQCLDGYKGDRCDQPCPATTFGPECSLNCSLNCKDSLCDAVSGVCTSCPSGKDGDLCDENCPANKYGSRCTKVCSTNCLNQLCDGTDGNCNHCPSGRRGDYCDQDCAPGTYGNRCEEHCNVNCDGCDPVDGECSSCISGYAGIICDEECEYGKYGKDCNKDCSEFCNKNGTRQNESPCHHVSGTCLYGCVQNYTGLKCDTKPKETRADNSDSSPGLGIGLGIGLGVAALVVIVVVVIYCYRRRLSAQRSRRQRPPGYDPAEPTTEEHGYNELFKSHDGYNLPTDEATSAVTIEPPSKKSAQVTVQYVNHEPTTYEDIDSVGAHMVQEKQSKPGHDNEGYANL